MQIRSRFARTLAPLALSAVMAAPLIAAAQSSTVSDAQIEANVLKALAENNSLANQPISTSTVYGTVTLTGSVSDEAARDEAERIASHTAGVKKVIDQLSVGTAPAAQPAAGASMPPAQGAAIAQAAPQAQPGTDSGNASQDAQQDSYAQYPQGAQADPQAGQSQQPYAQYPQGQQQPYAGYPQQQGQYPQQQGQYPQQQGSGGQYQDQYPQQYQQQAQQPGYAPDGSYPTPPAGQRPRLYRRDYERQMAQGGYGQQQGYGQQPAYGQPGGQRVLVPAGTVLQVAINRWLSSGNAGPGSQFTALVANDVVANGQIAIPRGATVDGTVIDAKGAGVLKGRGMLTLQLNTLELGGQTIPLQSEPFTVEGHDKAARSVTSTLLGAGIGALFGGAIGGGAGAAIGAGVGGAAGLGTAAATNSGQATLPPESLLRFRLTSPTPVVTVSEAEMQRLGGYAGPAAGYGERRAYPAPYPAVGVGVYAAPYPYYYRRGYYRGYWY